MSTPIKEKNGTYGIRSCYIDNLGNKVRKYKGGFKKPNEAITWEQNYKNNLIKKDSDFKLYEFMEYFLETKLSQNIAPVTIKDYKYYFNVIKNEIGNINLSKITPFMIQKILNSFKETPSKQAHFKQNFCSLLSFAYKQDFISSNPFDKISMPPKKKPKIKFYDSKELEKLLNIVKETNMKYYAVLYLSSLGLRPSEVVMVKENDFKTINGTCYLIVDESISVINKIEYIRNTKNQSSIRKIPITEETINSLLIYKKENNIISEYVCCDLNGNRISTGSFYQFIKTTIKNFNLPYITPYGLRHTFGNINKFLGIDSYTVSKLMGHSSPRTTEEHYYKDDPELNKIAMGKYLTNLKSAN